MSYHLGTTGHLATRVLQLNSHCQYFPELISVETGVVEFECGADFIGWNRHLFGDREGEGARRRGVKGYIEVCRSDNVGGDGVEPRAPRHLTFGLTRQINSLEDTPIH